MRRATPRWGGTGLLVVVSVLGLVACGDKPQQATGAQKSADSESWKGGNPAFTAGNWKQGDRDSWEEQMKARNQNQNEYSRAR